uniref:Uncharacterized protein n=1 Tax=Peronospora matthiolae TaxID=2874970 RepID=A0AAV1ULI6_9STRA
MAEKVEPFREGWVESVTLAKMFIARLTHADELRSDDTMIKHFAEVIPHEDLAGLCRSLRHIPVVKEYTASLVPAELFKIMDKQNQSLEV